MEKLHAEGDRSASVSRFASFRVGFFLGFAALTKLFAGTMMLAVILFGLAFAGSLVAYVFHKANG